MRRSHPRAAGALDPRRLSPPVGGAAIEEWRLRVSSKVIVDEGAVADLPGGAKEASEAGRNWH